MSNLPLQFHLSRSSRKSTQGKSVKVIRFFLELLDFRREGVLCRQKVKFLCEEDGVGQEWMGIKLCKALG